MIRLSRVRLPIACVGLAGALLVSGFGAPAAAQRSVPEAGEIVRVLAGDEMRGRGAGSAELDRAKVLIEGWMNAAGLKPGLGKSFRQLLVGPNEEVLANVLGRISGSGREWIVVGAHYDGLGVGLPGTADAGQVLNGADDNASGVAALLHTALRVARAGPLDRTVYFVAFSGEETGLLGSKAFVENPPAPLDRCAAMLNLDTVGRIRDERVIVFGTGTAEEFPAVLKGVNFPFGFDLAFHSEGLGASDHAPFFEKGIPVLHFFSGTHADYHAPGDDPDLVDGAGVGKLAEFVAELVTYLAAEPVPLTFRPAGIERLAAAEPGTKRRRVSFGSIPDFSRESGGILLSGVMPGGAAEAAGLAAGDVLVELAGMPLDTIQDFQAVLTEHEPGDEVTVRYVRGDETLESAVTLRERKR